MLGAELFDECLGDVASEVPVHLPNVDLEAVLAAGGEAFGDLIALGGDVRRDGQHRARVVGDAAPEHVGEDRGEAVVLQVEDRVIPGAVLDAVGAVAPDGAELTRLGRMREAIGFLEEAHGLVGAGEGLGELAGLFLGEGIGPRGDRGVESGQRHRRRSRTRTHEGAGGGEILEFAELIEAAQLDRDAVVPDGRTEQAGHGEQELGFVLLVVVKEHMRHQDGVIRGDDGGEAGGFARVVEPFGHGTAAASDRLVRDDVPGSLTGGGGSADQRCVDRSNRGEASLGVGEQVLAGADAGGVEKARGQRIEGQESAFVA